MVFSKELSLGATVCINGCQAPEFADPEGAPLDVQNEAFIGPSTIVIQKYIQSTPGAHYCIRLGPLDGSRFKGWLQPSRPNNRLDFAIYIDGQLCGCQGLYLAGFTADKPYYNNVEGMFIKENGRCGVLQFQFNAFRTETAAPKRLFEDWNTASSLGLIQVVVRRAISRGPNAKQNWVEMKTRGVTELAEMALKGRSLSHATWYTEPVQVPEFVFIDATYPDTHATAVFNFKYRSRANLEHDMIVPAPRRPPTPDLLASLSSQGEVYRLTREHVQQKIRDRDRDRRATGGEVREEGRPPVRAKREREPEVWGLVDEVGPLRKISRPTPTPTIGPLEPRREELNGRVSTC